MRFMEKNNIVLKLLFLLVVLVACQSFVACQTDKWKVATALKQCQDLLDKDDVQAAGECYGKAIFANPGSATEISKAGEDAVFKKCVELHDKKNYKQAITCFDAATALKPDNASVYFLLADSYYQYHRANNDGTTDLLDKAEEAIKQGLEVRSSSAVAHETYGLILDAKKEYQRAAEEYRQSIKLDSKTSDYWIRLALTQEKLNDLWGATTSYKQSLMIEPNSTLALYNSGFLYEKLGEIDKAISAYEKLLKIKISYDDAEERLKSLKKQREDEKLKNTMTKSKAAGKT